MTTTAVTTAPEPTEYETLLARRDGLQRQREELRAQLREMNHATRRYAVRRDEYDPPEDVTISARGEAIEAALHTLRDELAPVEAALWDQRTITAHVAARRPALEAILAANDPSSQEYRDAVNALRRLTYLAQDAADRPRRIAPSHQSAFGA